MTSPPDFEAGILALLAVFAVAVAYTLYIISQRRIREALYSGSRSLDIEEYYEKYFADSGIHQAIVAAVLVALTQFTPLDFSRIDPDEPFTRMGDNLADSWEDVGEHIETSLIVSVKEIKEFSTTRELIQNVAELDPTIPDYWN